MQSQSGQTVNLVSRNGMRDLDDLVIANVHEQFVGLCIRTTEIAFSFADQHLLCIAKILFPRTLQFHIGLQALGDLLQRIVHWEICFHIVAALVHIHVGFLFAVSVRK